MRVIHHLTTSNFNKKAEALALLLGRYRNSLFVSNGIFEDFVVKLKAVVSTINADFPRTKPFEVYSVSEYGITITVAGNPEKVVAHMSIATIKCFVSEGDIYPIEDLILQTRE